MNQVCLVGRLTRDPEVRVSPNGVKVGSFTIAVDRGVKRDENNPDQVTADFPGIKVFGKTCEIVEKYFHKGNRIGIVGRIQTGKYQNQNGQTVYTTDVIADRVEFVESKGTTQPNSLSGNVAPRNDSFMNIPEEVDEELPFK